MASLFSLAHLTALELSPPDLISVAARVGYDRVGLRLLPATPEQKVYPMLGGTALMRETLQRLADTGITVLDIEIVRLEPGTNVRDLAPFLEAGSELGAKHVLVAGADPDESRLIDLYAAFCDLAAPFGLTADLELMPWTSVPDLTRATRIVGAAARPNAGVLIDALHFDRSNSRTDDLAALPGTWLHYMQLCDAPAERPKDTAGLIHAAREERMFPGDGGIDLAGILRTMPRDIPISLEIPMHTLAQTVTAEERARRALAASKALLEKIGQ